MWMDVWMGACRLSCRSSNEGTQCAVAHVPIACHGSACKLAQWYRQLTPADAASMHLRLQPFGPVLPIIRVKDTQEAVEHVNANRLALQVG